MFRRSNPASRLSNTEMKKLESLWTMVDSATSARSFGPDPVLNQKIADDISNYPNPTIVYEVIRRVRKCFKSSSPTVVMNALSLTQVLMDSCGVHARGEIGSEKFMRWMGKLCKIHMSKQDEAWHGVAEYAQDLVENWAERNSRGVRRARIMRNCETSCVE
ncbi:unnamed protein product [Discosporangium mesarthrocarpum]